MIARASAEPSCGSVPAPTSSSKTRLSDETWSSIEMMLLMCDENVDRLCSILCSSPISTKTDGKTLTTDESSAGMNSPVCAIIVSNPTVLSATVLPPVFGPVMSSTRYRSPISISIGTTSSRSMRGCLACTSRT